VFLLLEASISCDRLLDEETWKSSVVDQELFSQVGSGIIVLDPPLDPRPDPRPDPTFLTYKNLLIFLCKFILEGGPWTNEI
jgi:hypothetical protein